MAGGGKSVAEIAGLFNTLQGHVDDIRSRLQCGICIRPLYEPFSLACGHTFCYTCLAQWFSGGRSKRTCPDCRAAVKTQPAPAYLIREIVQMFTSRAELLDRGETTHEHLANRLAETEKLDQDKANTNPQTGGLFGGLFKPKGPALKPLVDVDDGVLRCPRCQWELEENSCGGCGWTYRENDDVTDLSESGDDDDDYDEDTDFDSMVDGEEPDEDAFGFDEDQIFGGPYGPYGPHYLFGDGVSGGSIFDPLIHALDNRGYHRRFWGARPPADPYDSHFDDENEDDFDDEEDAYDEADSFIDDEENQTFHQNDSDHSTVVGENRHHPRGPSARRHGRPVVNLDSSDDEENEENEHDERAAYMGLLGRLAESRSSSLDPTDTSDLETAQRSLREHPSNRSLRSPDPTPHFHITRSAPRVSSFINDEASEEEEDHYEEEEEDQEGTVYDDNSDDDDEDEMPIQRGRFHMRQEIPASSDESEVTGSPSPRPSRHSRLTGSSTQNAIPVADSDDEQPVGPIRRATQRRHARFSPY
ncbi:hypothetical protein PDE_03671 [Penicillium oxalicum 114-2]|uniref:RING-type domain-containing protein n=1 Tax=Penicillium oxalicum (strain 114-2 / CGMCC 5302) TaxID=933388 RepID=S7ZDI8_PENO1|nr:hypothetical protein PDE_03671 [Penicillium oxalicum 114-2]